MNLTLRRRTAARLKAREDARIAQLRQCYTCLKELAAIGDMFGDRVSDEARQFQGECIAKTRAHINKLHIGSTSLNIRW